MNQDKIGKFISVLRKENNLTQEELGEKLGVSGKTISRWENGNYMPDISMFEPLANNLNVTITELLKGERIEEKDQLIESNKNILNILIGNKKQKKFLSRVLGIMGIIFIILAVLSMFQTFKLKQLREDYVDNVTFMNGIYTNGMGVKINEVEYSILLSLQLNNGEIDKLSEIEFKNYLDFYYSQIESYKWYGYVGGYVPSRKVNDMIIMKLVDKKLPLIAGPLEAASGEYCYLGDSKYGTMIMAKYENEKCLITEVECSRLKDEGTNYRVNIEGYCG